MTLDEEMVIDEKIQAMNKEEMQSRFDELDGKEELTESEEYEVSELEDRLDDFSADDEEENEDDDSSEQKENPEYK